MIDPPLQTFESSHLAFEFLQLGGYCCHHQLFILLSADVTANGQVAQPADPFTGQIGTRGR